MSGKQERTIIGLAISISVIILIAVVILAVINQQPTENIQPEHQYEYSLSAPPAESTAEPVKIDIRPAVGSRMSLNDVIKAARTWDTVYNSWFGKTAPDFTLTDIAGKQHKLSDYRGKDVLIIFWATWCGPCLIEIPHLIALRNTIGENKLAMLAISNENPALVKEFTADRKINYTVLSDPGTMPKPFNTITSIPCSFFIDSKGKIKLATEGLLSLGEIKAILQAE